MPWKETCAVNERMKFVVRLEDGERMADLCREFGISRKTGYKLKKRFEELGRYGLVDQSRRPHGHPGRTPEAIRELLIEERRRRPTWGPRKLIAYLKRHHPDVRFPALSTSYKILKDAGLVEPRRRVRRVVPHTEPLRHAKLANDVWCADFKGQFKLGNGRYCYPLTITDARTRFLLGCEGLDSTKHAGARAVFEHVFRRYGLPKAIRTDNGTPFSSRAICGLSRLAVWWRRLGIAHERIEPGHPEQNGRHERMHRTLKAEATRPAGANLLQQQERLDAFVETYNFERPHEALEDRPPADFYRASPRAYRMPGDPEYPFHDVAVRVLLNGQVEVPAGRPGHRIRVYLSEVLAGELVGLREVEHNRWLVTFIDDDLGTLDLDARRLVTS